MDTMFLHSKLFKYIYSFYPPVSIVFKFIQYIYCIFLDAKLFVCTWMHKEYYYRDTYHQFIASSHYIVNLSIMNLTSLLKVWKYSKRIWMWNISVMIQPLYYWTSQNVQNCIHVIQIHNTCTHI